MIRWLCLIVAAAITAGSFEPSGASAELPDMLMSSAEMAERLERLADADPRFALETIGQSVEGKPLWAVRVTPEARMAIRWKVLLIGGQHGDEHAGKEAILELLADIASGEESLPPGVELWAVPMANPDGVDRDERRNANGFDLNRDHLILSQPETIALHKLVQRERPHAIVDCHEFTRDSTSYTDKGWGEWPLIMMDGANNPVLPNATLSPVRHWVDAPREAMKAAGFNYRRYTVGGPPPDQELRFSTLDPDDARNGLSFYGGLGFIIESGIKRAAEDPQANLATRVEAYRLLLRLFVDNEELQNRTLASLAADRWPGHWEAEADRIPTNAFWARAMRGSPTYPVLDLDTGQTLEVPALNLMNIVVYKRLVTRPLGYAVLPERAAAYRSLLDMHAVTYKLLEGPRLVSAELAKLERVEEDFDPIYERYGGRQIVRVEADGGYELPGGSLWIDLAELAESEPMMARRAIKVLEPQQLYGLYQWPAWRATVSEDGAIPVVRVLSD
ncbi:MAG: M14 family zinc carboxypeptidase [Planctomycetota bacterium]